jgi:hypothetical protein
VIEDGRTGFLVRDTNAAASRLRDLPHIDRAACRQRVQHCFSIEKMVEGYERVYQTIFELEAARS